MIIGDLVKTIILMIVIVKMISTLVIALFRAMTNS